MKISDIWEGPILLMPSSGKYVKLLDTDPSTIDINDIALTLSNTCRFGGRCQKFYSVAEHCVHVSNHVSKSCALHGLLHDAAEAYLIDVPKPLQVIFQGYNKLESNMLAIIFHKFNLVTHIPEQVIAADKYIGITEYWHMISKKYCDSNPKIDLSVADKDFRFKYWQPKDARFAFIKRFKELIEC
jgi:hypothetical protein